MLENDSTIIVKEDPIKPATIKYVIVKKNI